MIVCIGFDIGFWLVDIVVIYENECGVGDGFKNVDVFFMMKLWNNC